MSEKFIRQGAAHSGLRFFLPEYGNKEAAEALCFLTNGTFLLILLLKTVLEIDNRRLCENGKQITHL